MCANFDTEQEMSELTLSFGHPDYDDSTLSESIGSLLSSNHLGAMASIRDGSTSHINTAYFVHDSHLTLYFLSQPSDQHSANISQCDSVAVAIWATPERWGESLHGVQLFGRCEMLGTGTELAKAMGLFLATFSSFASIIRHPGQFIEGVTSRMYAVRPMSLKLIDEPRFGRRNYIVLDLAK